MSIWCKLGFHKFFNKKGTVASEVCNKGYGFGIEYSQLNWKVCIKCGLKRNEYVDRWFHVNLK